MTHKKKKHNVNDFTKKENRDRSLYRASVILKRGSYWAKYYNRESLTRYAFNTGTPQSKLARLKQLLEKYRRHLYQPIKIYCNQTDKLIEEIEPIED